MQLTETPTPPDSSQPWQEEEIHLSDYLNVLRRRKTVFFAVFFLVFALVAIYTFLATPIYQASGTLHVRDEKGKVDLLGELGLGQGSPIESEIEILKSRTNIEEVVRRLHLDWKVDKKSPELAVQVGEFSSTAAEPVYSITLTGAGSFDVKDSDGALMGQGRAGELLLGPGLKLLLTDLLGEKGDKFRLTRLSFNTTVRNLRAQINASQLGKKTNIIKLSYSSSDPIVARDVVNTLVQVFLERSVTLKTQEASKSLEFITGQLQNVRLELDAAEKQLESFKSTSGLVQLDTEAESFIERLAEIEKQLAALSIRKKQIDFAIEAFSAAQAQGQIYTPAILADDPTVAAMAQKLVEYEVQKKALLVEYTVEHPAVLVLSRQVAEVQSKILATYQSIRENLAQQQAGLTAQLSRYDQQLKQLPAAERQLVHLVRQAKVNADIYTFLLQKFEEARILRASTMSNIDIIDPAIAADKPIKPQKKKNLLLGLIVGIMMGVGLAFFLEYMDDTIKDPEVAKRLLGLPALVTIPFLGNKEKLADGRAHTLVSQLDPKAPAAEAFRALRTGVHFSAINKEKRILMITSPFPGEGKTTISANLAVTLAQTGDRVLIIGCDLRKPALHEFFAGHKLPGLTEVLVGDQTFDSAVNLEGAVGVDFLSSGSTPPNPAELLGSETMAQLVAELRDRYDHIILDAPPLLAVTDAVILSELADLALIVFELGRNSTKVTQLMRDQLANIQTPLAGLVFNDKEAKGASYYGGSYGGYYGGYYGETEQ
ncbi:MAG: polysaccharide biosynthesis tyrosine autokinase, partial [Desulfuromonadales bacterium]|nr:polysaccharide biosynthesis tyrosine autokinase [Desulfuromonadales bacterium]